MAFPAQTTHVWSRHCWSLHSAEQCAVHTAEPVCHEQSTLWDKNAKAVGIKPPPLTENHCYCFVLCIYTKALDGLKALEGFSSFREISGGARWIKGRWVQWESSSVVRLCRPKSLKMGHVFLLHCCWAIKFNTFTFITSSGILKWLLHCRWKTSLIAFFFLNILLVRKYKSFFLLSDFCIHFWSCTCESLLYVRTPQLSFLTG